MHDTNHEQPDTLRLFAPEEMVNASDLKDWGLLQPRMVPEPAGFRVTDRAFQERQAGIVFHEQQAEASRKASSRQMLWWAIFLALLGIAFLLVKGLVEGWQ